MPLNFRFIIVLGALVLYACGGHKRETPTVVDNNAPTVTGVTTSFVSQGVVKLTASAFDSSGVTGYCFKSGSSIAPAAPAASDACFQASSEKSITLSTPQQRYYVWAKDAAGNVSFPPTVGPCSSNGFTESDRFTASDGSPLKTVCMMTSLGEMVLGLENVKAPNTVANFLKYVNDGFYSNTVFHRILSNFMVQGGGFTVNSGGVLVEKAATYGPIVMEKPADTGLSHVTGTIAMARLPGDFDSAKSEFFINVVNNTSFDTLDPDPAGGNSDNLYAVFGKVISGTTTLNSIKTVSVQSNGGSPPVMSLPLNPPVILWAIQMK